LLRRSAATRSWRSGNRYMSSPTRRFARSLRRRCARRWWTKPTRSFRG
jgi:hypothetical protein